ncbi:MAG TPA: sigma 54-interacting transcriptional regulator [Pseudomonadota bacterium]|nr:sigma 54-interacting transcriptional regulator [Pseudomonadota bacterium]
MTRISIRARGLTEPLSADIAPGMALLIGRTPDVSRLHGRVPGVVQLPNLGSLQVQTVRVDSPRVSGNHLLIWNEVDAVSLLDLVSRNGSWLRLAEGQRISLSGAMEITADLAGPIHAESRLSLPEDADWNNEKQFSAAVVRALTEWLGRLGVSARIVHVTQTRTEESESSFLLADDTTLQVRGMETITQDFSWASLLDRIRAYVHEQNRRFEQYQKRGDGMIIASRALREVLRRVGDAAARGQRLILLGPTGVGKDLLARCFHRYSQREKGPFAALNCALLDKDLLYAQLFGARRGSFTGAISDIIGAVESAHEGTLFLDELGEMSLDVQRALLRFLDTRGEYQRLGDPRPRRADVQVVCATNVPLDDPSYRNGRFREDLWYRLAAAVVHVPPLRERPEDILAFLMARTLPGSSLRVSEALADDALELLLADSWPGNFRDLEHFIERLPLTNEPQSISRSVCEAALRQGRGSERGSSQESLPQRERVAIRRPRTVETTRVNDALNWRDIAVTAVDAFLEDNGDGALSWGQLHEYVEKYLKPVFVAQACDLAQLEEMNKALNYSALARRLNIADGSTVKMHLGRYVERFRLPRNKKPS